MSIKARMNPLLTEKSYEHTEVFTLAGGYSVNHKVKCHSDATLSRFKGCWYLLTTGRCTTASSSTPDLRSILRAQSTSRAVALRYAHTDVSGTELVFKPRGFLKPQCSMAPPMQRGRSVDACSCFSGMCPLHQRRLSSGTSDDERRSESVEKVQLYYLFLLLFHYRKKKISEHFTLSSQEQNSLLKKLKELLSRGWTAALESKVYRPCNNLGSNYGTCYYKSDSVPRSGDYPPISMFQLPEHGHNDKPVWEACSGDQAGGFWEDLQASPGEPYSAAIC
ncbi:hypothetical protein PAMP_013534 [Pampus punctatissimus]